MWRRLHDHRDERKRRAVAACTLIKTNFAKVFNQYMDIKKIDEHFKNFHHWWTFSEKCV
jgi:hypothetical protein